MVSGHFYGINQNTCSLVEARSLSRTKAGTAARVTCGVQLWACPIVPKLDDSFLLLTYSSPSWQAHVRGLPGRTIGDEADPPIAVEIRAQKIQVDFAGRTRNRGMMDTETTGTAMETAGWNEDIEIKAARDLLIAIEADNMTIETEKMTETEGVCLTRQLPRATARQIASLRRRKRSPPFHSRLKK